MKNSTVSRRVVTGLVVGLSVLLMGCEPPAPSEGRNTPVRKVTIVGDSITHSNFGTSPRPYEEVRSNLEPLGIKVKFLGFPGDSMFRPWPNKPSWESLVRSEVKTNNPDVIILQSINIPGPENAENDATYVTRVTAILDAAQAKGAHVYLVSHGFGSTSRLSEFNRAQKLQARAAKGRGIETIPLGWWMDRCPTPHISDGFHLSENGTQCYANAMGMAVRQLQKVVG